ncbi:unnamed protein product, partial [Didymodactylos carnosus]
MYSGVHRRILRGQTRPGKAELKQCKYVIAQWTLGMLRSGMRSGTVVNGINDAL